MTRRQLIYICQQYHEHVHLLFGLISFFFVAALVPSYHPAFYLLIASVIGCYLPDIDHLLYFFVYGKSQKYAQKVLSLVRQSQYSAAIDYCRSHHKDNHSIVSHNLLSPFLSFIFFSWFLRLGHPILAAFFLAITSHFIFDIAEDYLVHGRLNPNWYLKFSPAQA